MAKKTEPQVDPMITNMKAVSEMYRDILSIVSVDDVKMIDHLKGEDRRDFCKFAHQVFNSSHFNLIVKNLVFAQAMLVTEKGWDHVAYQNGQMAINGVHLLREILWKHANIFDTEYSQREVEFDPHRSFSPGKIEEV